ncbi:MAG: hypothetical protein N3C12_01435 [Candidatus Binatia bacterium]|nr:hypothetical protein [Candidatus Binatia bacterium]
MRTAIDDVLPRLAGYVDLRLISPRNDRFVRIYRARHPARRDRVMLYLYDLSAHDDDRAETLARREFEALHRLQTYRWAPRILDSFQPVPGYHGEMFFFTIVDPDAPSLRERSTDTTWAVRELIAFAVRALAALRELHATKDGGAPTLHRNLSPNTILVRHDNTPLLTGMHLARIPGDETIATAVQPEQLDPTTTAPRCWRAGSRRRPLLPTCTPFVPRCKCCLLVGAKLKARRRTPYLP